MKIVSNTKENLNSSLKNQVCTCLCGESKIIVSHKPMARFRCHCSICQGLYNKPFADFTFLNAKHVSLEKTDRLEFAKHRLPPALNRGICSSCNTPLVGFMWLAPWLKFAFIPSERFENSALLPECRAHIFYHSRSADIDDSLPKISGYWPSEIAISKALVQGLFKS